jgi:hypothetical protein
MKRNKRFFVLGLCALMLLSAVSAANVFAADEVTVTGTVYATAWDDDDNVTAAVIADSDEEFVIIANAAGRELFKLNYNNVKVSGVIGQDNEGNKTFTVSRYEVMPE